MPDIETAFFVVAMGGLGLIFGSFANVVIWRIPRGESLSTPGSHCPGCGAPVRWIDNVPLASWLLLRGRCRSCREPIAVRYPFVEFLTGVLWVLAALVFGVTVQSVLAALFFCTLLILTFIDFDVMRLPNPIVGALAVLGLGSAAFSQFIGVPLAPLIGDVCGPLPSSLIGALLGGGLSGGVAALYALIRGRSGFGMGDVKLLGAMGLFLGPYVLLALMVGSMVGAVYGITSAARSRSGMSHKIPFGPFLALGGVVTALTGVQLVGWYLALVGLE